ncbi:MAG: RNA-binding domain-containing protein [Vulcanisaeta sp.]|jgi:RNA binding exosome subunit|uniref:RNA-binding domain-containing protein n=1 Tax=Vulcanisaeta sp. TaxID=2020871 RepID=UPI003D098744
MTLNSVQLEVETIIHATEDLDKIVDSLIRLLTENAPIIVEVLYGHYGNPIYKVYSFISDKELVRNVISVICSSFINKESLLSTITNRIDASGNIFIRFDKQEFVKGRLVIVDGDDVIRLRIRAVGVDTMQFINEICK